MTNHQAPTAAPLNLMDVLAILDQLALRTTDSPNKTYSTGHKRGAAMAYGLAATMVRQAVTELVS